MNKQLTLLKSPLLFIVFLFISVQLTAQNFSVSNLQGESLTRPTSLQFGPDGRLYVSQQNGFILAYTIERNGSTNYQITATETIDVVRDIQNHEDDDGSISPSNIEDIEDRQLTGLLVTGTANNVIIYAGSSDPRIGGGGGGQDKNLDTNSGIISRLTKSGNNWQRLDLVRGLPRSEENHANNGMQLRGNLLYVAQGGNTNAGAPSNNFAFSTEYALSAAILTVDIAAIDAMPTKTAADGSQYKYDIPTLDDPTRPNINGQDIGDPFGGNDGLNQAKIVAGGPVQVHASGFRNIYDVLWTADNKLYTWDNGANGGWGGHPANEGFGTATNNWVAGEPGSNGPGPNDRQVNNLDALHFVTGNNYYGGHPNPVRANPTGAGLFTHDSSLGSGGNVGVWRTSTNGANPLPVDWPPVPSNLANPIEGDFQNPGEDDVSLLTVTNSTNGLVEYTASNFNNAMKGNLLAVSFRGQLYRVQRNSSGGLASNNPFTTLAENFGSQPLDVTALGDDANFPGTIWVANLRGNSISIFEPQDFSNCSGGNNFQDDDGDRYTNSDELANGTDPCNTASIPADFDKSLIGGFLVSNLNDPDDDDDGINDNVDPFVWDAQNGLTTNIPIDYPLLNTDPGIGFFGLGFTGLMSNGTTDYLDLIQDEDNSTTEIIAGGAVGLLTFNNVPKGDPIKNTDTQQNGFQFGINVNQNTPPFVYEGRLVGPIFNTTPQNFQSAGIFIGTGTQRDYLKVVINGNGSTTGMQILYEAANNIAVDQKLPINNIGFESEISLFMEVTPSTGQVQVQYAVGNNPPQNIGQAVQLSGSLLNTLQSNQALAIGIINTSTRSTSIFNATYDYLNVDFIANTPPDPVMISNLNTSTNSLNFANNNTSQSLTLTNSGNTQAITIEGLIVNNNAFSANLSQGLPLNLPPGEQVTVAVGFTSENNESGQLTIQHTGNNGPTSTINLTTSISPPDNDGDGFPQSEDCNDNDPNLTVIGAGCTDGNPNTTNDIVQNNCTCAGTPISGDDMVTEDCNGNTIEHGDRTITLISGGSASFFKILDANWQFIDNCGYNCGNSFTVSGLETGDYRVFFEDSNYQPICDKLITLGGGGDGGGSSGGGGNNDPDNDGDGFPQSEDCNDNDPNLTIIGASCTDGNANTTNDVVQNNCTCAGIPTSGGDVVNEDCGGNTISHGNGTITLISGGNASFFKILDENWQFVDNCGFNCGNSFTVNGLQAGGYRVFFEDSNYQPICDKLITLGSGGGTGNGDGSGGSGNNDPDNDGDGFPQSEDCNDNDPNLTIIGASCTDGNANTTNDVVQNNCTCAGIPTSGGGIVNEDCGGNTISHGNGTITLISGGNASFFKILDENWQFVDNCGFNCGNSFTVNGLQAGGYRVFFEDSNYQPICDKLISLGSGGGNPPPPPPPPTASSIYINTGGPAVNVGGINWEADQYFSAGIASTRSNVAVSNTTNDAIYQSERFVRGDMDYNIPVTNGTYEVRLHFAEIYYINNRAGIGRRIFNINLEGQNVLTNYDINAVTGANVATPNIQIFTTTVSDGALTINFNQVVENPKISAIAIIPVSENRSSQRQFEAFATTGRKVKLNWVYPQVNQPMYYEVEHAKGTESYQLLTSIEAEPTLDLVAYGTMHEQPATGANHYRIKVVFQGGGYDYIDPKVVSFDTLDEFLTVFPNPTTGQLFVDLSDYENQQVDLTLVNINGQTILQEQLAIGHPLIAELDVSTFDNGFYMLKAKVGGRRLVAQKVMILRQY